LGVVGTQLAIGVERCHIVINNHVEIPP